MAYAMRDIVASFDWVNGDTVVVNDPYLGGTHLPDVTLISPVFVDGNLVAFVANRAHHADIGSDSPGSMPISNSLYEEGLLLSPKLLAQNNKLDEQCWNEILSNLRTDSDTRGDFLAQMAANQKGVARLQTLVKGFAVKNGGIDLSLFTQGLKQLNQYGEQLARSFYKNIPDGVYAAKDFMDDD